MKKQTVFFLIMNLLVAFAGISKAAEWNLFEKTGVGQNGQPWAIRLVGATVPDDKSSDVKLTSQSNYLGEDGDSQLMMGQLKLSFIDIASEEEVSSAPSQVEPTPELTIYTGTKGYLEDTSASKLFNENIDWTASTFILFFGINLNVGPGYFQSNAFISQPPENNKLNAIPETVGLLKGKMVNTDAKGFNAAAGYKLSDLVTLEAGYGYVEHNKNKSKSGDEAWAIYAQAVLSLAPGVQVIPEIGQIDFDKNPSNGTAANNFYAGAKWEINF